MRYDLDSNGYINDVVWGCTTGTCIEYTGTVPSGYTDLVDWSDNACIQAYYIVDGNLVLDSDKLSDCNKKIEQETIDNEPLLHKDIYTTNEILDSQYKNGYSTGEVITIDNVKKINPKVKITNIDCYSYDQIDIISQGKNLLKNDAITETLSGVIFTKNTNGSITITGTSTEAIEYNLSGDSDNTTPIFVLKGNKDYYLNIGDLQCEMKFYDGTTSQVYIGDSGVINLSDSKSVTQVLIKIPSGTTIDKTIFPQLEYGSVSTDYVDYKIKKLTVDFSEYVGDTAIYPNDSSIEHTALKSGTTKSGISKALSLVTENIDGVYPSETLYPNGTTIDYIYIDNGKISISVEGIVQFLSTGNVNLFDGYNTFYTIQDTIIEISYSINELAGVFSGDVLNNDYKLIGEHGLLTNLMFSSDGQYENFNVLGFRPSNTSLETMVNSDVSLDFDIPENYHIVNACLSVYHTPACWLAFNEETGENYNVWGYSRNIKLYKVLGNSNFTFHASFGGEYSTEISNDDLEEVTGAFITNNFTNHDTPTIEKINSIDIKNSLVAGRNKLIVRSGDTIPSMLADVYLKSGMSRIVLNVLGYMKY